MSATNQAEQTALTLPQRAAVALGAAEHEVKLRELVKSSADIVAVIDPAGREQAHRIGMTLKNARVAIEKSGKAAREDAVAFGKAVVAEEKRLIAIVTPEEDRVFGLRDTFDAAEQARKDAEIAKERARVEAIQADIAAIRDTAMGAAGKPSTVIRASIDVLEEIEATKERFAEFAEDAAKVIGATMDKLLEMLESATASEAAAIAAEEARKAEAARIEAERQELARQRAENERIANEQAAERQRLADLQAAQEAAAAKQRAEAEANARAEREAQEAETRRQQEAIAEQQRQIAAQQAEVEAQRAAFAAEQEAARKKVEDAAKLEFDHAEALVIDAQVNGEREAERIRLQAIYEQSMADARALPSNVAELMADNLPRPESACARDARIDSGEEEGPSDEDIIEFGKEWMLDRDALVARLEKFIVDQRELAEAE